LTTDGRHPDSRRIESGAGRIVIGRPRLWEN
jgi:hypothetical protein